MKRLSHSKCHCYLLYDMIHQDSTDPETELQREIQHTIDLYTIPPGSETAATEIKPRIWLGNVVAAADKNFLSKARISAIINVSDTQPKKFLEILYLNFAIKDDWLNAKQVMSIMQKCLAFIHSACQHPRGAVLIHCKKGHHRSAVVMLYYLMSCGMPLNEAITYIKLRRPTALRRITFMMKCLMTLEVEKRLAQ